MIFGLFKKAENADLIFKGGKIYTLDPDAPWAEAVACKDGRILAVGDENVIESLAGRDTEVIDLEGGVLLPGFIDTCGHPVLQAFRDVCLILYDDMTLEQVLDTVSEYIKNNPDRSGYFAYGFNTQFTLNMTGDEAHAMLDRICTDKPIALLDISGFEGWFNTKAMDMVRASIADEPETPIITLSYILHVLSPFDFDSLQRSVIQLAAEFCRKGYTTMFDCGAPDYLHAIYQEMIVEMLQADMLKQRFIGSLLITRNISSDYIIRKLNQKCTSCAEIEEYVNCKTLKLILDKSTDLGENMQVSPDLLKILAIQASDKGFNLHIDTIGKGAIADAFEAAFLARAAGYKRAHFVIAHSYGLSQEEKTELILDNELCETTSTLGDYNKKYRGIESAKDVTDAIDKLTIDAAVLLGISDDYGSIENDKFADFVIFDENPFDCNLPRFRSLCSSKTVIGGEIVYDAKSDNTEKWQEILKERQNEMNERTLDEENSGLLDY